jgi:hypothetical protein
MPISKELLEQIERDALNGETSVADGLRKCVALGGRAGSPELREWANRGLDVRDARQPDPADRLAVC